MTSDKFSKEQIGFTRHRAGFTILETIIVVFVGAILAATLFVGLSEFRNRQELTDTAKKMGALLREAQSRSMSRTSSTSWGVHFENSTNTTPFFGLFAGTYSTGTRAGGYYSLPVSVVYSTTSLSLGGLTDITFAEITGVASASTSITIQAVSSGASSTISVASSGYVSY